jgi:hypothetical protein
LDAFTSEYFTVKLSFGDSELPEIEFQ